MIGGTDLGDIIRRVAHKPVGNQSVCYSQMFGMSWGNGCSKQTLNQELPTDTERSKVTCDKPTLFLKAGDSRDNTGRRQNVKPISRQQLKGMMSKQEFGKGAKRQIPWWYWKLWLERDGSGLKSNLYSSKGSWFYSQHLHGCSPRPVTQFPSSDTFFWPPRAKHTCDTQTHMEAKHSNRKILFF